MPQSQGGQPTSPWSANSEPQLPPSPASSRGTTTGPPLSEHEGSEESFSEKHGEKAFHDASIFVGSLPSNMSHVELTHLLTEHLSGYPEVKSIKVIRDSKGGVCAFVQCEDAETARALMHTLRDVCPKPFLGRVLRFEPARAFRTLHVSYRAPSYVIPGYGTPQIQDPAELPAAMRIWKPQGSKLHYIAYNAEAASAESRSQDQDSFPEESSIYMHPVAFDESCLHKLANYFGNVEKMEPFQLEDHRGGEIQSTPHSAPRLACMDSRCWEIKWDLREDCVAALMALRRIPHFTVTWAHQDHAPGSEFYPHPRVSHHRHQTQAPVANPSFFASPGSFLSLAHLVPQSQDAGLASARKPILFVGPMQERSSIPSLEREPKDEAVPEPPKVASASGPMLQPLRSAPHGRELYTPSSHATSSANMHQAPPLAATDGNCVYIIGNKIPATPKVPAATYTLSHAGWVEGVPNSPGIPREVQTHRDIDPTSIFVGGLDVVGQNPWSEERVKSYFSRYGGLESVKFVKPFDATTAFAFIKYNNTDSPARAVIEEHNRVCGGRVLRVQLRDCNPPRQPWKNYRGRGRYQNHHFIPHRRLFVAERKLPVDEQPQSVSPGHDGDQASSPAMQQPIASSPMMPRTSPASDDRTLHDLSPSPSMRVPEQPSLKDTHAEVPPTHSLLQRYREWYDDLQPSAPSVTMSGPPPAYPYIFPNAYYPPPPGWVPTHMYQAPYPYPYHPVYQMQLPQNASDSSDAATPRTCMGNSRHNIPAYAGDAVAQHPTSFLDATGCRTHSVTPGHASERSHSVSQSGQLPGAGAPGGLHCPPWYRHSCFVQPNTIAPPAGHPSAWSPVQFPPPPQLPQPVASFAQPPAYAPSQTPGSDLLQNNTVFAHGSGPPSHTVNVGQKRQSGHRRDHFHNGQNRNHHAGRSYSHTGKPFRQNMAAFNQAATTEGVGFEHMNGFVQGDSSTARKRTQQVFVRG
ncbi:hypothetical protein BKA70DRAFT_1250993 [Coprinopsis sp. MPI-PUGE-AT-0042]|nr:hypothetical protein BKA70DRAFT_1250993 [Coprinopsis sp. MPI-PUGE-AT-0042]